MRAVHEKIIAGIIAAQAYAKFWVAFIGGGLAIVSANIPIDPQVQSWITTGLAIATAFSVWAVPNLTPPLSIAEAEQAVRQAHANDVDQANS